MNADDIRALEQRYLAPTYKRAPMVWVSGSGVYLKDSEGRNYLDFACGLGVNCLGHDDPGIRAAINEQPLIHVSNLYHTAPHALLARDLCEASFADRVFFCNSGTEASEGAIKFARKSTGRPELVTFKDGFHGRSLGALSITDGEKRRQPFEPLVPGVRWATFNDLDSVRRVVGEKTAAVVVEPVQGEGGIFPGTPEFLKGLRELCDETGCLLVFDEVQCGLGRTGHLWAHEPSGVSPDLLTLAKPLGGGLPIGAILMTQKVASCLEPGDHGSTFAAGPLITTVARHVFSRLSDPRFLATVRERGRSLAQRLEPLTAHEKVVDVRGCGLMWAVELVPDVEAAGIVSECYDRGVVLASAGHNSVRFLPPLIVEEDHITQAVQALEEALG